MNIAQKFKNLFDSFVLSDNDKLLFLIDNHEYFDCYYSAGDICQHTFIFIDDSAIVFTDKEVIYNDKID